MIIALIASGCAWITIGLAAEGHHRQALSTFGLACAAAIAFVCI